MTPDQKDEITAAIDAAISCIHDPAVFSPDQISALENMIECLRVAVEVLQR